jgi:hypothetical protein
VRWLKHAPLLTGFWGTLKTRAWYVFCHAILVPSLCIIFLLYLVRSSLAAMQLLLPTRGCLCLFQALDVILVEKDKGSATVALLMVLLPPSRLSSFTFLLRLPVRCSSSCSTFASQS